MKDRIAEQVKAIPRSGIRDFFEIVQSMSDVISLGIGEPDFLTPWHIREAAIYGLEKGRTKYTSNLGLPRLRKAISDYLGRRYSLSYDQHSEVIITVGVSEAIDLALRALLNPGDEVIYHEPCYVSYGPTISLAGGVPVAVSTVEEDGFSLTAKALEAAITPRSKVLVLNFPTNPTGATLSGEELRRIADLCVKHDLIVLTDEIYCEIIYDGVKHESIAGLPGMRERTLYLNGFSKAYSMTGFRIGYACGPAPLIDAMMRIHQYSILCAPIMGQEAGVEALDHGADSVENMRREYERRRNFIVNSFHEIGIPCARPGGSFYVFPRISVTGMNSQDFAVGLLREHKVAVVPGPAFGPCGAGYVRCSYATGMEQLRIAMQRIGEYVSARSVAAPAPLVAAR